MTRGESRVGRARPAPVESNQGIPFSADKSFDHGHGFVADDNRSIAGVARRRHRSLADRWRAEGATEDEAESISQSGYGSCNQVPRQLARYAAGAAWAGSVRGGRGCPAP